MDKDTADKFANITKKVYAEQSKFFLNVRAALQEYEYIGFLEQGNAGREGECLFSYTSMSIICRDARYCRDGDGDDGGTVPRQKLSIILNYRCICVIMNDH